MYTTTTPVKPERGQAHEWGTGGGGETSGETLRGKLLKFIEWNFQPIAMRSGSADGLIAAIVPSKSGTRLGASALWRPCRQVSWPIAW